MYYILSKKYRLRGWDKLPYARIAITPVGE